METTPLNTTAIRAVTMTGGLFFDVREDEWLGKTNPFCFIAGQIKNNTAIVMDQAGNIKRINAGRNLKQYLKQDFTATTTVEGVSERDISRFDLLTSTMAIQAMATDRSTSLYKKLENHAPFALLRLFDSKPFNSEKVFKNTLIRSKKSFAWDHSVLDDAGEPKLKSVRSFSHAEHGHIILTDAEHDRMQSMINDLKYRDGLSVEEYCHASRHINSAIMLICKAIGSRAVFDLYHYKERTASVTVGNFKLLLSLYGDMLDVTVLHNGSTVAHLGSFVSLPDIERTSGAVISTNLLSSELSCKAYFALKNAMEQHKKAKNT